MRGDAGFCSVGIGERLLSAFRVGLSFGDVSAFLGGLRRELA